MEYCNDDSQSMSSAGARQMKGLKSGFSSTIFSGTEITVALCKRQSSVSFADGRSNDCVAAATGIAVSVRLKALSSTISLLKQLPTSWQCQDLSLLLAKEVVAAKTKKQKKQKTSVSVVAYKLKYIYIYSVLPRL